MSEQTPSQAEGEREEDDAAAGAARGPGRDAPRTTPSQAEGEREEDEEEGEANREERGREE
ncbi:hypothetical protein [Streptomyces griseomycini]|uniref:Uncharacterized protein n=1 Tax=Streptomyces griseomycini TaxID=66895 RepID=A0A7W7PQH9_9ACTN|nr:hypothetical protein [Streptomyces griseomycini]MBB4898549.1 hypothetical protein [Streptomyces griseomycini]GGQ16802.1 hypothetical protein GCM10010266_45080 [Streptomyces griseomycini]GGR27833.1 hypothetical protein GCM10015536_36670 [Streptomyces griseomycini]